MVIAVRDRRVLPALVALAVAAFLIVPMLFSTPISSAQSQEGPENPCENPPRSQFDDRDEAAEAHRRSIDCVDHADISNGTAGGRLFRPLQQVTRGQMASFIINTINAAGLGDRLPNGDPPDEFNDIADNTHRTTINQLARINVVRGTSGGRYEPNEFVRRDQMASFLLQTLEWAYGEDYNTSNSYFGDVPPSNQHFGTINAAYEQGLVRGTTEPQTGQPNSGTYTPSRNVLRQAMASFLTNELAALLGANEEECPSPSPSPTGSATATASPTTSASPTATATASSTASPQATATATATPTSTASPDPSPSSILPTLGAVSGASSSNNDSIQVDAALQQSESPSPGASASPTGTASPGGTASPTSTATATGTPCPSGSPSGSPTGTSTASPSPGGTATGTASPSPQSSASASPTSSPTTSPSP